MLVFGAPEFSCQSVELVGGVLLCQTVAGRSNERQVSLVISRGRPQQVGVLGEFCWQAFLFF